MRTATRLVIVTLLFISYHVSGQTNVGLTGAVNFSNLHKEDSKPLVRYAFGLNARVPVSEKFGLTALLQYSAEGWKFKSYVPSETGGEMNLHYLDFQLLGVYKLNKSIFLLAGGEIGYLFKTRRDPYESTFNNYYEKVNLSIIPGLRFAASKKLSVDVKYLHGISYLIKLNGVDFNGNKIVDKDGYLRALQIGLTLDIIALNRHVKQRL